MQILPREENWGQSFGQGLSSGLSQGMQALANMKMQQYAQRQQSARTQSALEQYGIPKGQAQAVSQMDPAMQQAYFKNYLQAPQNEAYANAWQQLLGGGQQTPMPGMGMQALTAGQQNGMPAMPGQATQQGVPSLKGLSREQIEKLGPIALTEQYRQKKLASDATFKQQAADLAQEKQTTNEIEAVRPFIERENAQLKSLKNAADLAKTMQDIVKKSYHKFPGIVARNLPTSLGDYLITDPDVSRYMSGLNEMPLLMAQTRKGMPSNYKIQLEQLAKARAGQPAKAQINILQEPINKYNEELQRSHFIESLRDKKTGLLPVNVEEKALQYDMAMEKPLEYPDLFKENTVIEENGKRYRLMSKDKKKEWKEL